MRTLSFFWMSRKRSKKPPSAFLKSAEETRIAKSNPLEVMSVLFFHRRLGRAAFALTPRLELEHLGLKRDDAESTRARFKRNPRTRFHGNVPAFMAEARGRIAAGERVLLAAGNLGELERYVDLCHEYEIPYRLGEIEENATSTRLAEDSSAGSIPAVVLCRAPFTDGVVFLDARLAIYGTGDFLKRCRRARRHGGDPRRPAFSAIFPS